MSKVSVINQGEEEPRLELPPGFRFHPTDEEVVSHYLTPKAFDRLFSCVVIADVDLNKCEPWDLPSKAKMGEKEWYFFCNKDRKYPTGMRTNRATERGYWKATGKDKEIFRGRGVLVGMRKTLVFYLGRAPRGEKTPWVMHEYRLEGKLPPHLPRSAQCFSNLLRAGRMGRVPGVQQRLGGQEWPNGAGRWRRCGGHGAERFARLPRRLPRHRRAAAAHGPAVRRRGRGRRLQGRFHLRRRVHHTAVHGLSGRQDGAGAAAAAAADPVLLLPACDEQQLRRRVLAPGRHGGPGRDTGVLQGRGVGAAEPVARRRDGARRRGHVVV